MPNISIGVQKMDILYKEEDKIKKLRQTDTQTEWTYLGMGRHEEDDDKGGKDDNHLYNKMIMTKVKTKVAKT